MKHHIEQGTAKREQGFPSSIRPAPRYPPQVLSNIIGDSMAENGHWNDPPEQQRASEGEEAEYPQSNEQFSMGESAPMWFESAQREPDFDFERLLGESGFALRPEETISERISVYAGPEESNAGWQMQEGLIVPQQLELHSGPMPREPEEVTWLEDEEARRRQEEVQAYLNSVSVEEQWTTLDLDNWGIPRQPAIAEEPPEPDPIEVYNENNVRNFGDPTCECSSMDIPFMPTNSQGNAKVCLNCGKEYQLGWF
jgi:hypothetical protein